MVTWASGVGVATVRDCCQIGARHGCLDLLPTMWVNRVGDIKVNLGITLKSFDGGFIPQVTAAVAAERSVDGILVLT